MTDSMQHNLSDDVPVIEAQLLLSRLVDGEVGPEDRARFEQLATAESELWRQLAEERESAALLQRAVEYDIDAALQVDLPDIARSSRMLARRWPWIAAGLGWAAAIALAVVWFAEAGRPPTDDVLQPVDLPPVGTTIAHDEALKQYLEAPWVRGQMQPHVLDSEPMPDGTTRYWILRRIEEYVDVPTGQPVIIDAEGNLVADPAELREQRPREDDDPAPAPGS